MAIAIFLDRMCMALLASGLWLRYATLQNLPFGNLGRAAIKASDKTRAHVAFGGGGLGLKAVLVVGMG